jgi:hypothetical protein
MQPFRATLTDDAGQASTRRSSIITMRWRTIIIKRPIITRTANTRWPRSTPRRRTNTASMRTNIPGRPMTFRTSESRWRGRSIRPSPNLSIVSRMRCALGAAEAGVVRNPNGAELQQVIRAAGPLESARTIRGPSQLGDDPECWSPLGDPNEAQAAAEPGPCRPARVQRGARSCVTTATVRATAPLPATVAARIRACRTSASGVR